jgi:MFS transporter, DHA1 family, inner membrane transport protein
MAYLKNSAVNRLSVNYGFYALAVSGGWSFAAVFLLKTGVPIPAVFGALGLIVLGRFVVRPVVVILAPRYGLKPLLAFGTLFSGVQYLLIADIHTVGPVLLSFCGAAAIGDAFYWTSYHAYFAKTGDAQHRGHQISVREAFASTSAIAGPLLGGWALTHFGPQFSFGVAAAVHVFAALPLIGMPAVTVEREVPGAFRAARFGVLLFAADGWIAVGSYFAWQIALFFVLGESYSAYGGVLASAAVVGAIGGLVLGRHIDGGHAGKAVWITFAAVTVMVLFRAGATHNAALAVLGNALGALAGCLYIPTLMTAVYNQAKISPCALRFHAAAEGGWDIGCASGCLVAAIVTGLGAPLSSVILLSMAGVALSFTILRRHYVAVLAIA